ncbi:MAG: VIT and VWA domain-containing protein [Myxococcota bacterium]
MLLLALIFTALASIVPLSDVTYDVAVSGPLAEVQITQTFHNPSNETVEAVYLFPLHERAVVDAMVMRLDDRTIEGRIEEVEAAKAQYAEAIAKGQTAALTESVRWNLFRQTVGNIPPGARIEVSLRIIQPVPRIEQRYELVLPLVAGARFVSPDLTEDQAMQMPYGDSPVRAQVHVLVDGGVSLRDFQVPSHEAFSSPTGDGWEVHAADLPMTRDFVARWSTVTDEPQVGALHDGEHLLLVFEPPGYVPPEDLRKREIVLVLDSSGSMGGPAWAYAQQAVVQIVQGLRDDDAIDLFTFSDRVVHHGRRLAALDARQYAQQVVYGLRPSGTTDLRGAVTAALREPADPERQRYVVVVSDGLVANESAILQDLAAYQGDTKVYALGVGGAVNRFVLEELASQGGGVAAHLRGSDGLDPATELLRAIARPTMSGIEVDWGDWGAMDMAPARIPDVHLGHPIQVLVRTKHEEGGPVVVTGRIGDEPVEIRVLPRHVQRGRAIASTWARQRIEALGRRQIREGIPAREEGLPLALEYGILSPWTAFIAIDPRVRQVQTASIDVPLGQPDDRKALMPDAPDTKPRPPVTIAQPSPDDRYAAIPKADRTVSQRSYEDVEVVERMAGATSVTLEREYTVTGTFSTNFDYAAITSIGPVTSSGGPPLPLPLYEGSARFRGLGGTTDALRRGDATLSLSAPLARDRFAVGALGRVDLQAIDGGSWRQVPVRLQSTARVGWTDTYVDVLGTGRWGHLEGPTADTVEADPTALRGGLWVHGTRFSVGGDVGRTAFDCGDCPGSRRTVGRVLATGRIGSTEPSGTQLAIDGIASRTGFAGITERNTTDLGLRAAFRHTGGPWVRLEQRTDLLWTDGSARLIPAGRAELGGVTRATYAALGVSRAVALDVPELSLPTALDAYGVLGVGLEEAGRGHFRLQLGWQRSRGPLALPIERLQVLPDGTWARDALVASAVADLPAGSDRQSLALTARFTHVLRSDADLASPLAPWTPGLLLAHRPLYVGLDTTVNVVDLRWSTDVSLSGGVASPVGGDRWWSGWQALADLGVTEHVPVRSGSLAFGVHGVLREGRPGDVDLTRPDGWFTPDRLGRLGVLGTLEVGL